MGDEFFSLAAESEHQRVEFLRTELSLCSSLISLAATEHVTGHHEAAERSRQHAEEGYATLMHFLSDPKHSQHLTKEQLYEFAVGANELRKELDSLRGDLTARI